MCLTSWIIRKYNIIELVATDKTLTVVIFVIQIYVRKAKTYAKIILLHTCRCRKKTTN